MKRKENIFLRKTNAWIILAIMVLFFFIIPNIVLGLGVSPASKTITFKPNSTMEEEFSIINSEKSSFEVALSGTGNYSEIIFFENNTVRIEPWVERTPFKTIFKFPSEMAPGVHRVFIKITPIVHPDEENMFSVYISPQIPVFIRVPYPRKYAEINIVTQEVDEGTPLPIYVEFDNLGSEKILNAGAKLSLYSPDGEVLSSMIAQSISIEKDSLGKSKAEPSPVLRRGLYKIVAEAYYDEFERKIEKNITLGEPLLSSRQLITKKAEIKPVTKLTFKVYNDWNTALQLTGFIEINSRKSEMPIFRIEKYSWSEVSGFADTEGLTPGDYNLSITWLYNGLEKKDVFTLKLVEKKEEPAKTKKTLLIIIICILIIVIIIIGIVVDKRKKTRTPIQNNAP